MKKCFLPLTFPLLFFCASISAQSLNRVTIKGMIRDTTGAEIPFATVMLLNPKDTTLVNFSRGDDKGNFTFKNVKNAPYLFKISYIGYIPYQQHLDVSTTEINDLGTVALKPINQELMEVVIKTAKAPLRIRGDTIEYDATTFKVPPGSTVEDLLRRLPGIEVDADGNIKAQGRDVRRVTVDGKTFFGDDPKSATKNLGAETISKVQVYDEKSEQAKLTGVDDGKKEKAMNLELKDEFKKGSFGKITGAIGTEERWAARGNYNRFNDKQQLSFIGYANNINQTGVNWEDYGEFKGQNTFSDRDNGDFGFSSGGGRVFYMGGEDTPLNNFDGRGFTENYGGGANYNFDNKKSKFNLSYFYNQTSLDLQQQALRETFLSDNSFANTDSTVKAEFRGNHSVNTRLEQEIDSNNLFIIKASTRFSKNDAGNRQYQLFYGSDEQLTNSLDVNNDSRLNSWRLSSAGIFRHRFKKKGRSFAASAGYNNSQSDGTEDLFSINRFFEANTLTEQIRQLNNNDNSTVQYKSSLLYTEPLSKKWFWENFYNFSQTGNEVNRQVLNPEIDNERIDNLSVFYDFNVLFNRVGSIVRYANQGLNISAGLAAQQLRMHGEYSVDKGMPLLTDPIRRTFTNLVPNVDMSYQFPNNVWLNFGYGYGVTEPKLQDLQPIPNVNNPAFLTEGNPDLSPERSHGFDLSLNHWNPASLASVGVSGSLNLYDNQIVYNQIIEMIDSFGIRTTTRPDNVSGGNQINGYLWSNFPIIKTKLTMNVNGGINTSLAPSFVNNVENETRNNGYSLRAGFSLTPGQKLILGLSGNVRFNKISYSIQEEQNQNIQNHGLDASVKWQFAGKFFLESNFNYSVYRNDRYGFNQDIPIFNASVRRLLGKNNRLEMRLAAFDILNRRVNISQYGSQNFVMRNVANTLARYYMLSVSYNIRGYEAKIGKNNWW